jgi:hypothetical protein
LEIQEVDIRDEARKRKIEVFVRRRSEKDL